MRVIIFLAVFFYWSSASMYAMQHQNGVFKKNVLENNLLVDFPEEIFREVVSWLDNKDFATLSRLSQQMTGMLKVFSSQDLEARGITLLVAFNKHNIYFINAFINQKNYELLKDDCYLARNFIKWLARNNHRAIVDILSNDNKFIALMNDKTNLEVATWKYLYENRDYRIATAGNDDDIDWQQVLVNDGLRIAAGCGLTGLVHLFVHDRNYTHFLEPESIVMAFGKAVHNHDTKVVAIILSNHSVVRCMDQECVRDAVKFASESNNLDMVFKLVNNNVIFSFLSIRWLKKTLKKIKALKINSFQVERLFELCISDKKKIVQR